MQQSRLGETLDFERQRVREAELRLRNARTGVNIFQASWILTFVALIIVNLQLRSSSPAWPPLGVEKLDAVLPTIATIGLVVSGVLVRRGFRAIRRDELAGFLVQWRAALGLGAVFVGLMAYEWLTLAPVPEARIVLANGEEVTAALTQYNAIFRVMTAFHGLHALIIGGYMLVMYRRVVQGRVTAAAELWPVEAGAKLWYFVVIAWLMFYVVLYWL
jgi:cytochrome c oxidase subunit 3